MIRYKKDLFFIRRQERLDPLQVPEEEKVPLTRGFEYLERWRPSSSSSSSLALQM